MLKALAAFIGEYRRHRVLRSKPRLVALGSAFYMAWCNSAKLSRDRWEWLWRASLWCGRRAYEAERARKQQFSANWRAQEAGERAEHQRRRVA